MPLVDMLYISSECGVSRIRIDYIHIGVRLPYVARSTLGGNARALDSGTSRYRLFTLFLFTNQPKSDESIGHDRIIVKHNKIQKRTSVVAPIAAAGAIPACLMKPQFIPLCRVPWLCPTCS